jgi:hypothetical protein
MYLLIFEIQTALETIRLSLVAAVNSSFKKGLCLQGAPGKTKAAAQRPIGI